MYFCGWNSFNSDLAFVFASVWKYIIIFMNSWISKKKKKSLRVRYSQKQQLNVLKNNFKRKREKNVLELQHNENQIQNRTYDGCETYRWKRPADCLSRDKYIIVNLSFWPSTNLTLRPIEPQMSLVRYDEDIWAEDIIDGFWL